MKHFNLIGIFKGADNISSTKREFRLVIANTANYYNYKNSNANGLVPTLRRGRRNWSSMGGFVAYKHFFLIE